MSFMSFKNYYTYKLAFINNKCSCCLTEMLPYREELSLPRAWKRKLVLLSLRKPTQTEKGR